MILWLQQIVRTRRHLWKKFYITMITVQQTHDCVRKIFEKMNPKSPPIKGSSGITCQLGLYIYHFWVLLEYCYNKIKTILIWEAEISSFVEKCTIEPIPVSISSCKSRYIVKLNCICFIMYFNLGWKDAFHTIMLN